MAAASSSAVNTGFKVLGLIVAGICTVLFVMWLASSVTGGGGGGGGSQWRAPAVGIPAPAQRQFISRPIPPPPPKVIANDPGGPGWTQTAPGTQGSCWFETPKVERCWNH